ncbi:MAG: glycosyltransferase family 39 protein [Acidobacteria bacterium]|nr:glycosyltransferase family 39 protein [Acidobacteriota bacterium]
MGAGGDPAPAAYLAARAAVAFFGVVNVALLYLLGTRLVGTRAALAAALLAVSPVGVQTAHMVRPDVALETLALLALLAFEHVGERPSGDVRSGLALGAAVALKFTGVLLAPTYLARRLLAPGRPVRGAILAASVATVAFVALSPYAVLHAPAFFEGVTTQIGYHYEEGHQPAASYAARLGGYASIWPKALGPVGAALAPADLAVAAGQWRRWAPLVALPLVTAAAMATSEIRFDRHMVPSFGVVALLAGAAVDALARRRVALVAVAAAVTAFFPLAASVSYVRELARPGTRDLALDWVEANVQPGARILSAVPGLGFDKTRYEVLEVPRKRKAARIQALHSDVVVTAGAEARTVLRDVAPAFVARPRSPFAGPPIQVRLVPLARRALYRPVPLLGAACAPRCPGPQRAPSSTASRTPDGGRPGRSGAGSGSKSRCPSPRSSAGSS